MSRAALQFLQHDLAGDAVLALRLLIIAVELLFQHAVDELDLLLFHQLATVFRLLAARLLGRARRLLGVTKHRRRQAQSLAPLQNGLRILSHVGFLLTYTLLRFGGRHPLCGIGVTSLIRFTSRPAACRERMAASRPEPGPLT